MLKLFFVFAVALAVSNAMSADEDLMDALEIMRNPSDKDVLVAATNCDSLEYVQKKYGNKLYYLDMYPAIYQSFCTVDELNLLFLDDRINAELYVADKLTDSFHDLIRESGDQVLEDEASTIRTFVNNFITKMSSTSLNKYEIKMHADFIKPIGADDVISVKDTAIAEAKCLQPEYIENKWGIDHLNYYMRLYKTLCVADELHVLFKNGRLDIENIAKNSARAFSDHIIGCANITGQDRADTFSLFTKCFLMEGKWVIHKMTTPKRK